jgi:catechol-2,3-dioxygenase
MAIQTTVATKDASMTAPIDPGVRIGHVHLKVADLDRALAFYCGVLGFELMQRFGSQAAFISAGGYHHHIGLNTWESRGAPPPPPGTTGLYHLAILYPTRAALADALRRVFEAKIPLDGRPITASAKRSICAIPTTTASSFTGTGRARPTASFRCSRATSI